MTPRFLALARAPLAVIVPMLLAGGCAPTDPAAEAARNAAAIAAAPEARVTGSGRNCIDTAQIRASVVRSDRVIDFEMTGGTVYRSTLPNRCIGLGFDRAITYDASIGQLCTQQIVYTFQNVGGRPQRGAGCNLGEFVPVEYVRD